VSFAPSDAKYADIDDDNVPDLVIGRTLARKSEDLATVVAKTIAFESRFGTGVYRDSRASVFAADKRDGQYSFKADAEQMVSVLPDGWQQTGTDGTPLVRTVYLDDYMDANSGELDVPAARDVLVGEINGGVALTALIGHSDHWRFTFDDLLDTWDIYYLIDKEVPTPTVMTQWGCWNAYYVSPYEDTMAHWALLIPGKGAAAMLGASTLSVAQHERALALKLYPRIAEPGKTVGEALLEAKRELAGENPSYADVILGWNYFGDPALTMEPNQ